MLRLGRRARIKIYFALGIWCALFVSIHLHAEELPNFNLADISGEELDPKTGWSAIQSEGDVKFRSALKGAQQKFRVKAWWKDGALRPAENTVYVLEVQFKDTLNSPAVFYSHGAIGGHWALSELHRFGGEGDGKWKTANIPLGWDYVIRLREAREKTAFGVLAQSDLPIGSIKVRLATKTDEEKYNAETRAWVAKAQAEKRKQFPLKIAPREFMAGKELPAIVAFSWPPMTPLLPQAQPKDEQVGAAIKLRMCLNELEPGSFGVYANGADLTGVDYAVSELKSDTGALLKADIVRRTAEYSLIRKSASMNQANSDFVFFPQRLWPAFKVDIPKGQSQWFLFNVRTKRGESQAGKYTGTVSISADQGKAELPLEVEVLPVDLLTMDEAGLSMGGCITGLVPLHDVSFQVEYNQNGANLWFHGISPGMTKKNGKLELDFTYMDDWLIGAKKRGLRNVVYFLGGDPYSFPMTMTIFRELAKIDAGEEREKVQKEWVKKQAATENREKPLPEDRTLFKEWVRLFHAHEKEAGWPEMILTPFDEPAKWVQSKNMSKYEGTIGTGPWIKPFFKDACAAIREVDPTIRIYASIHHANRSGDNEGPCFIPDTDVFCTNAIHEDATLGDQVRAAKKEFWQYSSFQNSPETAIFAFGFYFAAFDSRGSLCWAYNWGPGFDTTSGGDNWIYCWQTPFDSIPAPYFEGMREAWDIRRGIETCKKKLKGDQEALKLLNALLQEAATSRGKGGRDTVYDFWAVVDNVKKLEQWRARLMALLLRNGK